MEHRTTHAGRHLDAIVMMAFLIMSAALILTAGGCERRPDSGARIAESDEGAWIWLCSAEVIGPERPEKRAGGTATHIQKGQARRLAIAAACAKAQGGAPCSAQTADWAVENEDCTSETAKDGIENQRSTHRCQLEVVRPPGDRSHRAQTEGRTAEKACDRARREACRHLNGGDACEGAQKPWNVRTTVGRHRPQSL